MIRCVGAGLDPSRSAGSSLGGAAALFEPGGDEAGSGTVLGDATPAGLGAADRVGAALAGGVGLGEVVAPPAGRGVGGGEGAVVAVATAVGVAVGTGVLVAPGVGVAVAAGVGRGVGVGVGRGVGVGVGLGVGVGAGAGVADPVTLNETVSVGNVPEPHFGSPEAPGLSKARPVHVTVPAAWGVPVTRNTALSPIGRPTSGLSSAGSLKVIRVTPLAEDVTVRQPWTLADVSPFTETIAIPLIENEDGTSRITQVISSPPPSPPTFWTVSVTATCDPTAADWGDADRVHIRAASAVAGATRNGSAASTANPARILRRPITPLSAAVSTGLEAMRPGQAAARPGRSRCR